jgi:hypothetical protein
MTPVGGPGQTAVTFGRACYSAWSAREKQLPTGKRVLSKLGRLAAKPILHYLLPWTLPRLDPWLGGELITAGYMVEAVRRENSQNPRTSVPAEQASQSQKQLATAGA